MERPDRFQWYAQTIDVRGWAASSTGNPVTVQIFAGRRLLRELRPALVRTDLPADVIAAGATVGFETVISLADAPRRFWLQVVAVDTQQPTASRVLGLSLVKKIGRRTNIRSRAAYGEVWNSVAETLSDAQYSVAGTTDAQELAASGASTADDVARETGITAADTVLEIGCGVGRVGLHLAPRTARWIGADVSDHMLGYARQALAGIPNASFHQLNGTDLAGIADASINVVYCTGVFMHLDDWDRYRYITEARRVLTPGGRLYVDNMNLLSPQGWRLFSQLSQIDPLARPPNISKTSTPDELRWYAQQAGFTDIRVRGGELWVTVVATNPAA